MRSLVLFPFLLFSIVLYSQTNQDTIRKASIDEIESKISQMDRHTLAEIEYLKEKLDFQQQISEQTINSVSVQLEAASNNLTVFGILFAVAAILLGTYVTRVERKIVRIGEENKSLLAKSQKIKEDVEAVNELIRNDIPKLYTQIKREETENILDRLVNAPNEISEVSYALLSRELFPDNFSKFRQAYQNRDKVDCNVQHHYVGVFVRRFLAQTLLDTDLRKDFAGYITQIFYSSLEKEVTKCTLDLATVAVAEGISEFRRELNFFFNGLSDSKYERYKEIIQLLYVNLKTRKNRFDTFNVVESLERARFAKIAFGKLLWEEYSEDEPKELEIMAFEELKKLELGQDGEEDKV